MPFTSSGFAWRARNGKPAFPRSATHDWATPAALYEALNVEFGFDYDPCPFQSVEDGLLPLFAEWRGRRVFVNCPYGPSIRKWVERAPEADVAVLLLPARTDTSWFHEIVLRRASEIRFIRGRLKFGNATTGAPFPSMIVIFRNPAVALARCDREIEQAKLELRAGNPDVEGLTMALSDWSEEKRLIEGGGKP